jgi:hypothetical protein
VRDRLLDLTRCLIDFSIQGPVKKQSAVDWLVQYTCFPPKVFWGSARKILENSLLVSIQFHFFSLPTCNWSRVKLVHAMGGKISPDILNGWYDYLLLAWGVFLSIRTHLVTLCLCLSPRVCKRSVLQRYSIVFNGLPLSKKKSSMQYCYNHTVFTFLREISGF